MMKMTIFSESVPLWDEVTCASNFISRMVGLLRKSFMKPSEGLLFLNAPMIHTIGMKFPIDILFLDHKKRIKAIFKDVKPNRILPYISSRYTLEVLAGQCEIKSLHIGDELQWDGSSGQVLVEYALLMAVLVLAIIVMFPLLSETVVHFIESIWNYLTDL